MRTNRKRAKEIIRRATKTEYNQLIEEAFLTVRQQKILLMKKTNEQIASWQIANTLNVSVDTVNHEILKIYDKIIRVIDGV